MTKFILSIFIVVILLIHIINGRYLDFDYKTRNIYKRGCSVSVWCTGGVCYGSCGFSSCLLQDPDVGLPGKCQSIFGNFLLIIDSNKKAIHYFEELYKNNLSNNNNNHLLNNYGTYIITGNLTDAYAHNGQYYLTMKYAFDCYTIYKNFHPDYSVSIAVS
ncbi:unnamed protein product [Rotaria sordida]|uniref:Uncharacterized protein n=1 Tax=Rotaria sordida TaxID=392033 RepID=A0A819E6L8_9BILA|nr:unnamed protein product [Rotaria sordida]CAF3845289.1 unnamed protein product [Rotaria sordida]